MKPGRCAFAKSRSKQRFVIPALREWIIQTTGFLGRLFPTRLYHPALAGTPPEEGNWNHFGGLFQTPP